MTLPKPISINGHSPVVYITAPYGCLWISLFQSNVSVPETSFLCVFIKENLSVYLYVSSVKTSSNGKYGQGEVQTISPSIQKHTHLNIIALWLCYFFTASSPVTKSNISNRPAAQMLTALTFSHTSMHRKINILISSKSDFPSYALQTHTHTYLNGGAWQRAIDCLYLAWQTIHNFSLREA